MKNNLINKQYKFIFIKNNTLNFIQNDLSYKAFFF